MAVSTSLPSRRGVGGGGVRDRQLFLRESGQTVFQRAPFLHEQDAIQRLGRPSQGRVFQWKRKIT